MEKDHLAEAFVMRHRAKEIMNDFHQIAAEEDDDDEYFGELVEDMILSEIEREGMARKLIPHGRMDQTQQIARIRDYVESGFMAAVDPDRARLLINIAFALMEEMDWDSLSRQVRYIAVQEAQAEWQATGEDPDKSGFPKIRSFSVDPEKWEDLKKRAQDRNADQ